MEANNTGTAMTTFLEKAEIWMKNSNDNVSFVILCSSNKTGALIESACSSDMKEFVEDEEVLTKFRNACAKTSEVEKSLKLKKAKKLKDELQQKCHDLDNKPTLGQKCHDLDNKLTLGQGVDELQGYSLRPSSSKDKCWSDGDCPGKKREISENQFPESLKLPTLKLLRSCSRRHRFLSDGDLPDTKYEISESFQESKEFPQPLLPGATKVTETITNSNMTTDMKAQSTSATGTKSKNCTEVPDTIPFGGTFQHETTSTDEVPTATTNFSMGHLFNTETLDAKASVVNSTCPIPRYIKRPQETSTSNGPATCPDGCMAKEMPGEPRVKSAESLSEWSNEKKLRFIQDVNGWKDESASKYRIFVRDLEKGRAKIVKGNWTRRISKKILEGKQ